MKILLLLVLLVLCFLLSLATYCVLNTRDDFAPSTNNVSFPSAAAAAVVVHGSKYFQQLGPLDLHVRNATSVEQYISHYVSSLQTFNAEEKASLHSMIQSIDAHTYQHAWYSRIPWKLCKIDASMEGGFPHTLGDVIVLSDAFFNRSRRDQVRILMHEKVHVFQRANPSTCLGLYKAWGYSPLPQHIPEMLKRQLRSNPDIDTYYSIQNTLVVQVFDSNATALHHSRVKGYDVRTWKEVDDIKLDAIFRDVSDVHQLENPNEIMACMFPRMVLEPLANNSKWMEKMMQWSNKMA